MATKATKTNRRISFDDWRRLRMGLPSLISRSKLAAEQDPCITGLVTISGCCGCGALFRLAVVKCCRSIVQVHTTKNSLLLTILPTPNDIFGNAAWAAARL
jgi:hypothetical protein